MAKVIITAKEYDLSANTVKVTYTIDGGTKQTITVKQRSSMDKDILKAIYSKERIAGRMTTISNKI